MGAVVPSDCYIDVGPVIFILRFIGVLFIVVYP